METLKLLSRNEMKKIMGGYLSCGADCNGLYGGYYQQCWSTYGPSTDERSQCIDEVYDLNNACLDGCYQV